MELSVEEQLKAKSRRVEKLVGRAVTKVHPSPRPLGYRARIELKVDEEGRLGYFRPRTHDHVVVPECVIARPELVNTLKRLPKLPGLPGVELRSDGERVVLHVRSPTRRPGGQRPKAIAGLTRRLLGETALAEYGLTGIAVEGRSLLGESQLHIRAGGVDHRISPSSFYQVNLEVNEALVQRVGQLVRQRAASTVLDLYSGAGNLSMPLARSGLPVLQIELAGSSIRDARATADREDIDVEIKAGDASRFQAGDHFFDVAILDPPRKGAPGVLEQLLITRPRAILYVSCDPKSLARDLRRIEGQGYSVSSLELFDMFPQTSHAETLCILERSS